MRRRFIALSIVLSMLPFLALLTFYWVSMRGRLHSEREALITASTHDLDHVVEAIHTALKAKHAELQSAESQLSATSRALLERTGSAVVDPLLPEVVQVRQGSSGSTSELELPRFTLGVYDLHRDRELASSIATAVNGSATIYQLTSGGDLAGVSLSEESPAGPVVRSTDEATRAITQGRTHSGYDYRDGGWDVYAWVPITDVDREIRGALHVVQRHEAEELEGFANLTLGETGYPYVITGEGVLTIHPARAGDNIIDARDADGNTFIRDLVNRGVAISNSDNTVEIQTINYPWQNPGDPTARPKIVRFTYFEPFDWIVAAGSYEEEFYSGVIAAEQAQTRTFWWLAFFAAVVVIVVVTASYLFSRSITLPLELSLIHI